MSQQPPAFLQVDGISKRYGRVQALDNVSLEFRRGEIHAVLGENGAGKTTLMGVLAGFVTPDRGTVALNGEAVALGKPFLMRQTGIAMVHQHFTLVPAFTVAENLALANATSVYRPLNAAREAAEALELSRRLGWDLQADDRVEGLAVGVQQRIEITKALAGPSDVLILDEPTAVLARGEVEELFAILRKLRDEGRCIILIAHKLSEVLAIATRISVLRKGRFVATANARECDEQMLAQWMVGELPKLTERSPAQTSRGLLVSHLQVSGDRGHNAVSDVSFEVSKGEILGIGGVDGNGQQELAEAIAGVRRHQGGTVSWADGEVMEAAYIPQDRQTDGLALDMSVLENFCLGGYRRRGFRTFGFLKLRKLRTWAKRLIERFAIKSDSVDQPALSLSGGNQQKIVVARSLDSDPKLVVAVNPTRGLDVGAAAYVHDVLSQARASGAATLLFSTDPDELFEVSDRVLFMNAGKLYEGDKAAAYFGERG